MVTINFVQVSIFIFAFIIFRHFAWSVDKSVAENLRKPLQGWYGPQATVKDEGRGVWGKSSTPRRRHADEEHETKVKSIETGMKKQLEEFENMVKSFNIWLNKENEE